RLKGGGAPSDVEGVGGVEVASEGIGAVETYPGDAGGSHRSKEKLAKSVIPR
ncbi:hypothetical protein A2U01_0119404, partial [Trifolium medium]|nr:hypothetical protein [Trifolium medium]